MLGPENQFLDFLRVAVLHRFYCTSPNENFEYGYPHSNALLQSRLKLEHCKPHKAACNPTKYNVIHDVKIISTVFHKIYCRNFFMLSNQMSLTKSSVLEFKING